MKLSGGWALAAIIAVAFSWGAVAQVRNRVIQPSIEIPTTVALQPESIVTTSTITGSSPPVIRVEPEIVDDTTTTTVTQPAGGTPSTEAPPATTEPETAPPTTTTTAPATTTTTTPPSGTTQPPATTTSTTTTVPPSETATSSYQLTGGVVTISHSPGVVTFVTAIPQPGFSTDPRETGPDRVRVRFESDTHTSDFRAEWEGGELKITQNETGDD
jgi:hypothetical protein